jgi:signal transduction histidine kinase
LDLSAIEIGKHKIYKKSVSFQEIVEDCASIISERANQKSITYVSNTPHNLPLIQADRRALKQILLNILSNAVKFTPSGGNVTLTTTASKDALIFKVIDTGIGIPIESISDRTNPFTRGEPDPQKAQEGTGLGLAIVKSLVDLHDGKLTIESEVGVGTTVTVTLPLGHG